MLLLHTWDKFHRINLKTHRVQYKCFSYFFLGHPVVVSKWNPAFFSFWFISHVMNLKLLADGFLVSIKFLNIVKFLIDWYNPQFWNYHITCFSQIRRDFLIFLVLNSHGFFAHLVPNCSFPYVRLPVLPSKRHHVLEWNLLVILQEFQEISWEHASK